jgi:DNA replication factor GINS
MKLRDLREVQNRERSTDSLQELPDSFYEEVGEYIQQLKDERERAAERAEDPFDDPDVNRVTDEIETAEQVAEAIYERRVGKIVRQASFAAADMASEEDGLTTEERRLYDDITDRITDNKGHVLDVLAGDSEQQSEEETETTERDESAGEERVDPDPAPDPSTREHTGGEETRSPPESPEVGAADLMGSESSTAEEETPVEAGGEPAADGGTATRSTVRVTSDVGEVFGVDERVYTLESEDVVSLPEKTADALVAKDAAEPLE